MTSRSEDRAEDSQWQDHQPELLYLGLRCPVCLDYFEKPHTLACGHSFCLRCLRTLAKMARTSTSRSPLDRLRFRCPSCRKMTIARPLLRRRASVTIAIQDIVDAWFNSPYSAGKLESVTFRSISSQTTTDEDQNVHKSAKTKRDLEESANSTNELDITQNGADDNTGTSDSGDESKTAVEDICSEEIKHMIIHRFPTRSVKCKDIDITENKRATETHADTNNTTDTSSDVILETSSSEEESDQEVVPLLVDMQVFEQPERRHIISVRAFCAGFKLLFRETCALFRGILDSKCRLFLTIFWLTYGGLIVGLSRGFLPWMVLYTIVYFLIMYAEISRPFVLSRPKRYMKPCFNIKRRSAGIHAAALLLMLQAIKKILDDNKVLDQTAYTRSLI